MNVETQLARFRLGLLPGEALPDVAVAMLSQGFDTQALREIAGLHKPTLRDAGDAFARALTELGIARTRDDDIRLVISESLRAIADGHIDPAEGAAVLHHMWLELGYLEMLGEFVYLEDEWLENPADRVAIEEEIVAAARRLRFQLVGTAA